MNVNKKIKAFAVMLALLVCMCTVLPYGVLGTPAAAAGTRRRGGKRSNSPRRRSA